MSNKAKPTDWNYNYEMWHYLSQDEQRKIEYKMEKYSDRADKVDAILAKANKKGRKIYRRWKKCYKIYDGIPKPTTPEQEWFMMQMGCSLERATDDFMNENCDDFEMGLKLINAFLESKCTFA